jgi:hypothetical protein
MPGNTMPDATEGNFPKTYSMVRLIGCAMQLSAPWEVAV